MSTPQSHSKRHIDTNNATVLPFGLPHIFYAMFLIQIKKRKELLPISENKQLTTFDVQVEALINDSK